MNKRKYNIDEEWLSLIQECRSSGLTISNSAKAHQICPRKYKGGWAPYMNKKWEMTISI